MVTVYSPFFFQWTELVTPLYAPLADGIEAHIRAGIPQLPVDQAGKDAYREQLKPPTIRGRPIPTLQVDRNFDIEQIVKT
jgi:hypothetical protein